MMIPGSKGKVSKVSGGSEEVRFHRGGYRTFT